MDMVPVDSSHIHAVGHDPATGKLHVLFADGSKYEYDDVTEDHMAAFWSADSHGRHFSQHFKKAGVVCRRIG